LCRQQDGASRRLGLRRSGGEWLARSDGGDVPRLSDLHGLCPVLLFEPESHRLISGPAELRRKFLDWGLFHVEQGFLPAWRTYQRALNQRNAGLRSGASATELDPWELRMSSLGEEIGLMRDRYLNALNLTLKGLGSGMLSRIGEVELSFRQGWRVDASSLLDALRETRDRDRALGFTSVGPHRADWRPVLSSFRSSSRWQ
jgi:DNA replication and repair protein RecF